MIGAGVFAFGNLAFMTRGMLEYEALFMVTVYEGSMIVSNCASANVVMLEAEGLPYWRLAVYCGSVLLVILGMAEVCRGEGKIERPAEAEESQSFDKGNAA